MSKTPGRSCPACDEPRPKSGRRCHCRDTPEGLRLQRVAELLRSRDDWIPIPSQRLESESPPAEGIGDQTGLVRVIRYRCAHCRENPVREYGTVCDPCALALSRYNRSELRRLEREEAIREGRVRDDDDDPVLRRSRVHRASGSYAQLGKALLAVQAYQPRVAKLLESHYALRIPTDTTWPQRRAALEVLSSFLPVEFSVPHMPATAGELRELRDQRIREAVARGDSTGAVALREGVTQRRVQQLVSGDQDAA